MAECRQRDVTTVRQVLARLPSLLTVYDVTASAVFAASRHNAVAEALVDDVMDQLRINITEKKAAKFSGKFRLSKRSSCVDNTEARAYSAIGWIPSVGSIYSLVSAAVYAAKGCPGAAKSRAVSGIVDLAVDAVTFGTGSSLLKTVGKTLAKSVLGSLFG